MAQLVEQRTENLEDVNPNLAWSSLIFLKKKCLISMHVCPIFLVLLGSYVSIQLIIVKF